MIMTDKTHTYIGDGVYVSFDGFMVCLSTQRNGEWVNIFLEDQVYDELVRYAGQKFPHLKEINK